ncbi:MAG: hypothetical protein DCC75_09970 [Proteobacteria bacterium]|nr:MAG: hypothetical protein DCC75_09970 [Pseudomonadota bacterium]
MAVSSVLRGRTITYDPLEADPDYLVVGPWSRHVFKIYDSVISSGAFKEIKRIGDYSIYSRNS